MTTSGSKWSLQSGVPQVLPLAFSNRFQQVLLVRFEIPRAPSHVSLLQQDMPNVLQLGGSMWAMVIATEVLLYCCILIHLRYTNGWFRGMVVNRNDG